LLDPLSDCAHDGEIAGEAAVVLPAMTVAPLGWPIGKYGPTTPRPVIELVSLDRYGNRAFM
jgi:hypothetical protein